MDIKSLSDSPIQDTRKQNQTGSVSSTSSQSQSESSVSGGDDKVTLTGSASKLQELEARLASLPIVDAQLVSSVQRSLATGSFHFEPQTAADNLVEQEKNFALISEQK
ncbi:flagellar biosynthesis anti-sigma factor FlgM [Solemya velesiana gill symbiont]|uniref:Negative regulator of flagellin synthesis n=1 Tax=Solemya velesiana gill symbiont TaxID=1918948 RepID=A0A1T2KXW3_9GAMM|nr:flagellar biosynthesis anti-sigma factor FlgM [Solemya velesiana gill symbiont]OOZ37707.1 flagellar biosynthesis anti-sigma factor FlgM [Solemya velesiana gill symbiont]